MKPHLLEHARRLASGTAAAAALLALLALVPPADATMEAVTVEPPQPALCDSVTITASGSIPNNCYEVSAAEIRGPLPGILCLPPDPCPSRFVIEITVREPNPIIARACLVDPLPYKRSFNVGKLRTGPYDVMAIERVIPFSPDSTDSVVATSFTTASFTVRPDSACAATPGCFLLGFLPDRVGEEIPIDPQCTASAPPGGTACLDLALTNSRAVGGLQTTLDISGSALPVSADAPLHAVSVDPMGRAAGFQVGFSTEGSRTKLLLYSTSGASITPGDGPVVRICYAVAPGAVSQKFSVFPTAVLVADPAGDSIPPCPTFAAIPPGIICVGSQACDVNADGFSDVLDIIRLVRCALGVGSVRDSLGACPDSIAARADCNGDHAVDIRDVICCVRKIVEVPAGMGALIPSLLPRTGEIPAGENSISFEGAPRWISAFDGVAVVRIEAAENWGGIQFVINPRFAPVRIRSLSLDAASARAGTHLESAIDGSGIAHAMLYETSPGPRPAHSYRILVRLERVPSDVASGIVRIQAVRAGTSEGAEAGISLFSPSFDVGADVVAAPALLGARPNPTSSTTEVGFSLPADARAILRVYDVAGRLVRTLVEGPMTAGVHRARWDGLDSRGRAVTSGIYFAKLEVGRAIQSERILLLR
jgi:hypothetical protein